VQEAEIATGIDLGPEIEIGTDPGLGLEEGEGDLQVTDLIQEEEIEMEDGREAVGISVFCLIDLFAWKIISCYVNEQITH